MGLFDVVDDAHVESARRSVANGRTRFSVRVAICEGMAKHRSITGMQEASVAMTRLIERYLVDEQFSAAMDTVIETVFEMFPVDGDAE